MIRARKMQQCILLNANFPTYFSIDNHRCESSNNRRFLCFSQVSSRCISCFEDESVNESNKEYRVHRRERLNAELKARARRSRAARETGIIARDTCCTSARPLKRVCRRQYRATGHSSAAEKARLCRRTRSERGRPRSPSSVFRVAKGECKSVKGAPREIGS